LTIFNTLATPAADADINFVSDNTVKQLVVAVVPAGNLIFQNANGLDAFQDGDNIKVKKISVIMPYQYGGGEWDFENIMGLEWRQNAADVPIPELGQAGFLHLPANLCDSMKPNLVLAAPGVGDGNFSLKLSEYSINISQIFAPTILQAETVSFGFRMEVEHTLPMV